MHRWGDPWSRGTGAGEPAAATMTPASATAARQGRDKKRPPRLRGAMGSVPARKCGECSTCGPKGNRTPTSGLKGPRLNHSTMGPILSHYSHRPRSRQGKRRWRPRQRERGAWWDSNPQPTPYEGAALTLELQARAGAMTRAGSNEPDGRNPHPPPRAFLDPATSAGCRAIIPQPVLDRPRFGGVSTASSPGQPGTSHGAACIPPGLPRSPGQTPGAPTPAGA